MTNFPPHAPFPSTTPATAAQIGGAAVAGMIPSLRLAEPFFGMTLLNTETQGFLMGDAFENRLILPTVLLGGQGVTLSISPEPDEDNTMIAILYSGSHFRTTRMNVSWGDGVVTSHPRGGESETPSHEYASPGIYLVRAWTDMGQTATHEFEAVEE